MYIRTLGQSTAYMATYSDFRLVPKVTVMEWPNGCLTCVVATFVESLQRRGKYHWIGEVLL